MDGMVVWAGGGGLVIGLLFGLVMQRSRFCMVAAVSNMMLVRDYRQTQAFLAAWAIAIAGTSLLESGGYVAISESAYRVARIDWLGATGGGLMFGFGAVLAGGCATRTLVNTAEGHLGGLLALTTMIIFSGMAQYGSLEPARVALLELTAVHPGTEDSGLAMLLHVPSWLAGISVAIICLACIRLLGSVSENRAIILAGGLIGLLVVLGWFLTGFIAQDVFTSTVPTSAKITGPLARMNYSLVTGSEFPFSFSIAFVTGVFAGAVAGALMSGTFRWKRPDPALIPHYLVGGALMGTGATLAGGCNIGQGITGMSTLSLTSVLAAIAIFTGAVLGVKWWEQHA